MSSADPLKDLLELARSAAREGVVGPAASRCQHASPGGCNTKRSAARSAHQNPALRKSSTRHGGRAGLAPLSYLSNVFAKSTNSTT
jgi:hypothetical protein